MKIPNYDELMMKVVFFIAGVYLLVKVIFPIYSYSYILNTNVDNKALYYEQLISKTSESIASALPENINNYKLSTLFFSYLTGIDSNNPISYIANTVPTLSIANTPNIAAGDTEPVNVVPIDQSADNAPIIPKNTTPAAINKHTDASNENVVKPVSAQIKKSSLDIDKPEVLVLHSHTRESYNPDNKKEGNFSSNLGVTVAKVGDGLVNELEDTYGISTVHDVSIHDLPTRLGAYDRSRPTIEAYMKKYPSIRLIIDLHRDGEVKRAAYTAIINNEKYARVMFVSGTKFKNHQKYNKTSINFQNVFNHLYPGFSRGIDYKNSTYNQDLNPNMLLIEVGSNENSLDEAFRTSKLIAKVVAAYLK